MPFQSEQQRKYLWANEPAIAKRWEKYPKGYNTGGVSHLFRSKEPAHGGYVRPEDSGVLGLADGGNIRLQPHTATDLLVQKTSSGERPKYQPPGGGATSLGSGRDYSAPSSDRGPRDDPDRFGPVQTVTTTREDPAPPGEKGGPGYISPADLKTLQIKETITRGEEEKKDYVAPPKKKSFLGTLATAIAWYTGLAPLLGLQVPAVIQTLGTGFKMKSQLEYGLKKYNKQFGTNYSFDEFIAKTTDRLKKEHAERQEKMALYKSLPDGHPEKIQLQIDLQIGKKPEHLGDSGGNIDITYENIEETNDLKEKVRASKETMDFRYAPEKEDRSKQMAYWQSLMAPYMGGAMGMAAEGGRVPGGYNTGGLSNLFRLKNT